MNRTPPNITRWLTLITSAISVVALLIVLRYDLVMAYKDAMSHLAISHRVLFGTTPGIGQLGGVWLPLPHLLNLPFVGIDSLYRSGVAGSLVSMASHVVTVVTIYKIVHGLTSKTVAGIIAAAVFGLSAHMLYLQSTPMTESLLFCLIVLTIYNMQRWAETDQSRFLIAAAVTLVLASLTRYEAWIFLASTAGVMLIISYLRPTVGLDPALRRSRTWDRLIVFGLMSGTGIGMWLVWNLLLYGNPLYFQFSEYAKPPLEPNEPAVGDLPVALQTYGYAMGESVGWVILPLGIIGGAVFFAKELRNREMLMRALPSLALLPVLVFFVFAIYDGQRPLHVEQINGHMYNLRYGLIALIPASIFIGYLVGVIRRSTLRAAAIGLVSVAIVANGAITLQNGARHLVGIEHPSEMADLTAERFAAQYDGGLVLMESWHNENVAYSAVPSDQLIYEGSYRLWELALGSPDSQNIIWIIARCGNRTDKVCSQVNPDQLAAHYTLVEEIPDPEMGDIFRIYRHK